MSHFLWAMIYFTGRMRIERAVVRTGRKLCEVVKAEYCRRDNLSNPFARSGTFACLPGFVCLGRTAPNLTGTVPID